jgi:signal transduction histidine kinase/ketosteroid isomerase-like protein
MKLTKKQEAEILKVHEAYWHNYIHGDVESMIPLLDDNYTQVGSAEGEVFSNKKEAVQFLYDTIDQVAGKLEMRNRVTELEQQDNTILIHERCDLYALDGKKWIFYSKFRATTLMQEKKERWRITHQHSSFPDTKTEDGQNIAIDKIAEENQQLREAVKRRTIELEQKNRELEIETSLERVRAKALAMHSSNDLFDVANTLREQMGNLGQGELESSIVHLYMQDAEKFEAWYAYRALNDVQSPVITGHASVPKKACSWTKEVMAKYSSPETEYTIESRGQMIKDWYKVIEQSAPLTLEYNTDGEIIVPEVLYYHFSKFSDGALLMISEEWPTKEARELQQRAAKVFDFAYRRYLDLKLAEAQARESQIELALERVRARTMAMQHSEELMEAANLLFQQIQSLEIPIWTCGYNIWEIGENFCTGWMSTHGAIQPSFRIPLTESRSFIHMNESRQKGESFFVEEVSGEALADHYRYMFSLPDFKEIATEQLKDGFTLPTSQIHNVFNFKQGNLIFISAEPVPESWDIFKRFAKVFEQTYTRFLDLQKAEAQAREAQIEAALERVRSRTMGMQKSEELKEVIQVVYEQFVHLNIKIEHTGFVMDYKARDDYDIWVADPLGVPSQVIIPYFDSVYYNRFNEAKEKGEDFFATNLSFDEKNKFYKKLFEYIPGLPEQAKEFYFSCPGLAASTVLLDNVCLYIENFSGTPYSDEENNTLMRFGKVFQQTYTRFLDLQKAEAQAREAQIETALERVRNRTLAMQKSDELAETAAVLFKQLINLGIAPNRLYIGIIKDESGEIEAWATDEDGSKVSKQFTLSTRNYSVKKMYEGWAEHKKSITIDMQGKELEDYLHYLHNELNVPFKQGLTQKRRVQNIAYFSKGFIGIASPEEQPGETPHLLERFAAVFNLTYTRFNDLQIAEAHAIQAEEDLIKLQIEKKRAEDALNELQAAQKQLIQSEKMASLGELTAGIAHEIQNPLNFVNNFSEVSNEMLDEMMAEVAKGNYFEVKEILNDVKQNLEKINHHGKRAGDIVKGMLQHSRSSSGVKEPTDINALADEYLRLAYHGLRAKDKTFNATMKTDFDESIGSINIIPQDIGRVILNLITNAFYVVNEKALSAVATPTAAKYEPTVSVSTKKLGDKIEVSVKDNGNGIPQKVLDKIFQPFFTTKPTGQGTGLGLSLSYDIVKAHGGELKVETKEGEGSKFIIQLPG